MAENRTPTTKPVRAARKNSIHEFTLLSILTYIIDIRRRTVVAHRAQTVCISKKIPCNVCSIFMTDKRYESSCLNPLQTHLESSQTLNLLVFEPLPAKSLLTGLGSNNQGKKNKKAP
ncbi:hypothetical protein TW78_06010 [Vibrio coralliilyticus]|uniref:Uncharacterized protein n=1 Tax=Vibrio coralliilyticus TaxID=190893 RepID=A0A837G236_9VIBR|nr:hypothetical protein TW78_06010 [Vibrio coralliilyticus]